MSTRYRKLNRRQLIRVYRTNGHAFLRRARIARDQHDWFKFKSSMDSARQEFVACAKFILDGYFVLGGHRAVQ